MDNFILHNALYALAFLGSDSAAMAEQQQWFGGKPAYESSGLTFASDTEAYGGHLGKARELTKRAVDSAVRADNKEGGAIWGAIVAQREAAYGNPAEARQSAAEALKLGSDESGSRQLKPRLRLPWRAIRHEPSPWRKTWGSASRWTRRCSRFGCQRFRRNWRWTKRTRLPPLTALQAALPHRVGDHSVSSPIFPASIQRMYAERRISQPDKAALPPPSSKRLFDHSGIVWNCWTGALAFLGVARANALQARTLQGADAAPARARALAAYKEFLDLWKDADPDIPILKEAKAEYAKLQ